MRKWRETPRCVGKAHGERETDWDVQGAGEEWGKEEEGMIKKRERAREGRNKKDNR